MSKNLKSYWVVALVVAILISAAFAQWRTADYARTVTEKRDALKSELDDLKLRVAKATAESESYHAINKLAEKIEGHIRWEADSTNLLRWCSDPTETGNVRIVRSQIIQGRTGEDLVAGGKLRRLRFDLLLEGEYADLVRYLDRVEGSPYPMLVEQFTMTAKRGQSGIGELRIVISCLCPIAPQTESGNAA